MILQASFSVDVVRGWFWDCWYLQLWGLSQWCLLACHGRPDDGESLGFRKVPPKCLCAYLSRWSRGSSQIRLYQKQSSRFCNRLQSRGCSRQWALPPWRCRSRSQLSVRLMFSWEGRSGKFAVPWFRRDIQIFFGTNLQHNVKCLERRHRQQNGLLSAELVHHRMKWSLILELGSWSARTGIEGLDEYLLSVTLSQGPIFMGDGCRPSKTPPIISASARAVRIARGSCFIRQTLSALQIWERRRVMCKFMDRGILLWASLWEHLSWINPLSLLTIFS